jgi:hypothetical protein
MTPNLDRIDSIVNAGGREQGATCTATYQWPH